MNRNRRKKIKLQNSLSNTVLIRVSRLVFFRPNFINLASFQVGWPIKF